MKSKNLVEIDFWYKLRPGDFYVAHPGRGQKPVNQFLIIQNLSRRHTMTGNILHYIVAMSNEHQLFSYSASNKDRVQREIYSAYGFR